jgi:Tfp pilus assembly protein PilV
MKTLLVLIGVLLVLVGALALYNHINETANAQQPSTQTTGQVYSASGSVNVSIR